MTERSLDELGPVDYLIVEFPVGQQNFTGEGADELLRLHGLGLPEHEHHEVLRVGEAEIGEHGSVALVERAVQPVHEEAQLAVEQQRLVEQGLVELRRVDRRGVR